MVYNRECHIINKRTKDFFNKASLAKKITKTSFDVQGRHNCPKKLSSSTGSL